MFDRLLLPDLRELLETSDTEGLREFCEALHPAVVAEVLGRLDSIEVWRVLSSCSPETRVSIFQHLELPRQEELARELDRGQLSKLIEEMAPDDRVDLLSRLSEERVQTLLPLIAQAERNDIQRLLSLPEGSTGSIMTTEYASLRAEITVGEAIDQLRSQAPNRETIYYIYVIDESRELRGVVSLRELILAQPKTPLKDLIFTEPIAVRVGDDQETTAQTLARLDLIAVPVVDDHNHLVGIVTHDDVMDVLQEEATEDAYLQGAVGTLEDSYLQTPLITLAWKRGIWLMFLSIVALVTAEVLNRYEHVSRAYAWMVLFLPLVLASGGNAGSQSATLIIRTLALGSLSREENLRMAWREFLVGLTLGGVLAAIGYSAALIWFGLTIPQACVVAFTVLLVVVMGTVCGAALPILFRRLGMDPALMSNPLIAALVDVLGVVIYYSVAIFALGAIK